MLFVKIIGDPAKAAELLRTNRPLSKGMVIPFNDEVVGHKYAKENPDIFEVDVEKLAHSAKSNKKLGKSSNFKAK